MCIYIYVCVLAISKTPRFTEWTSTNLERSHRLPHICTKMIWQTWGVPLAGKITDLLDSRADAVLPFWSGIFAAGLWAIWGGATGRGVLQISFSPPPAWTASLLARTSTQPLYSELSSPPGVQTRMLWQAFRAPTGPNLCQKECQIECQYIYIYLSVCLSS